MGRSQSSLLLLSVKMMFLFKIFWQGLILGLAAQPSEEAEVLCSGFSCYTLHWGRYSWMEAQTMCRDNGGNLMTLKSQEEALLVGQLLGKMPKWGAGTEVEVRLWIGLHRERGKCQHQYLPLKGFTWVTGGEDTEYSKWGQEPLQTCTTKRCVSLQGTPSLSLELTWTDGHCSNSAGGEPGYLCKFSFQGMCRPLVLAGPGAVIYKTPFGLATASLAAVPRGSIAEVTCGPVGKEMSYAFRMCKAEPSSHAFEWSSSGPLCASPIHGCNYSNGGCEHECRELSGGLFECACRSGYQLGGDQLSCTLEDYCSSSPCQGQCLPRPGGYDCLCSLGYTLADDRLNCLDIDECINSSSCLDGDECQKEPCEQICINLKGSYRCLCHSGWTLAPNGTSCLPDTTGSTSSTTTQGEGEQENPTNHPPISEAPVLPSDPPIQAELETASVLQDVILQPGVLSSSQDAEDQPGNDHMDDSSSSSSSKQLLYYILGGVAVVLLLMVFALSLVTYRKMNAKKAKKKAKSAADNYSWVPDQGETKG
ncbi:complement component C1q receptor [Hemicordylus capensis]|uniref:complement component C1q receptor n=1 Tax=Hemicordylus capensis TaxID=884348 RepID=UPI0023034B16|nr:complement component C1q receptor [Hemicordylus capensis]XP_053169290.1 complement component C1q receptor [Hemicordylus capensis]XP_053169291.1 complement component C1q receptor [Hemicordylus capensis]